MPLNCQHGISIFDYFRPETKPTASRALHLSSFAEKAFKLAHASFLSFWCKHLQMWPLCIFDLNFDNHRHINMYLCTYVCVQILHSLKAYKKGFVNYIWIFIPRTSSELNLKKNEDYLGPKSSASLITIFMCV